MKLVIACSKEWFTLDKDIVESNEVLFIFNRQELESERIRAFDPDYIFFPHWNWIVSDKFFNNFECVVFHTAPLPYGRGGSPIQNLILRGFSRAPVCAIKMTSVLDGGPIYDKYEIDLSGRLVDIFARLNTAVNFLIRNILLKKPQPYGQEGDVYEFRRLTHRDNAIPQNLSLVDVYDRIRMLDAHGYPNAYIVIGNYKIEFCDVSYENEEITCKAHIVLGKDK